MNRRLGAFLIVSFLCMQMLSFLHMAEFGFEKHEHSGHVCQIYLHCEHTKYRPHNASIVLQAPKYVLFTITLSELLFLRSQSYGAASPRSPPLFS